jgi:hypothetical protein
MSGVPTSVRRASQVLWVVIALGALAALLTIPLRDSLIESWAMGHPDLREELERAGLDAIKDGSVPPPAFVPVAITMWVVVAGLMLVLDAFVRGGHRAGRVALTVVDVLLAFGVAVGLRTAPPAIFMVIAVVGLVLIVAHVVLLWRRPGPSATTV